jgi:hypothetical protein
MGDGIAPHCARAAQILVMIEKNTKGKKVPNRAQENQQNKLEPTENKKGKNEKIKKRTNGSIRLRKNKINRL